MGNPENEERVFYLDGIKDQHFKGPRKGKGAYASVFVLDPAITVERHGEEYHFAARFNLETTILRYNTQKRYI